MNMKILFTIKIGTWKKKNELASAKDELKCSQASLKQEREHIGGRY